MHCGGVQEGVRYPDGGHVWLGVPEESSVVHYPFMVASSASDPAWANAMLLHSKVADHSTQV